MKSTLTIILLATTFSNSIVAQESDSTQFKELAAEIESLKDINNYLRENLELTKKALDDVIEDKQLTDETKWEKIKSNANNSAKLYKTLSDDLINLKSRITNNQYENYIKSLSSVQTGPLGFSFDEVIIESVKSNSLFDKKSKLDRFIEITKGIINSPVVASIPFVSEAVSVSNSILDVAYSTSMNNKKIDLENLKKFEFEINKYISYYTKIDEANITNQNSNNDRKVLIENLQFELIENVKKEAVRLNIIISDQKPNEDIDDYSNRIFAEEFYRELIENYLVGIENKYQTDDQIDYSELLLKEWSIKDYNNRLNLLVKLSEEFIVYYDNFFELADNYQTKLIEAIEVAKTNGIIEGKKLDNQWLTSEEVYKEIIADLGEKKSDRDKDIKSSIHISELKSLIETIENFTLI